MQRSTCSVRWETSVSGVVCNACSRAQSWALRAPRAWSRSSSPAASWRLSAACSCADASASAALRVRSRARWWRAPIRTAWDITRARCSASCADKRGRRGRARWIRTPFLKRRSESGNIVGGDAAREGGSGAWAVAACERSHTCSWSRSFTTRMRPGGAKAQRQRRLKTLLKARAAQMGSGGREGVRCRERGVTPTSLLRPCSRA